MLNMPTIDKTIVLSFVNNLLHRIFDNFNIFETPFEKSIVDIIIFQIRKRNNSNFSNKNEDFN